MRKTIVGLAVLVAVLALGAATATASAKPAPNGRQYFISLGDSYSVGYQSDVGHTTLNGPASQLVKLAAKRGYRFKLVSFGCGGATTTSMLTQLSCPQAARLPGAAGFPGKTQVQAGLRSSSAIPEKSAWSRSRSVAMTSTAAWRYPIRSAAWPRTCRRRPPT